MSRERAVSAAGKLTVVALAIAAVGVAIQIASGHPYPMIPPAFFILLIPAAVIGLGRWWWAPILAVLSGLFLTFGLFAAGQTGRLTNPKSLADSFGLWTQTVAVLVATVCGVLATRTNLRRRSRVTGG
jgi:phosphoglycerol transferase MdoB-like AlkP superfamily enzyme